MNSKITSIVAASIFLLSLLVAFNSSVQEKISNSFNSDEREILTTLSANLINSGEDYKIVKVKMNQQLLVEVYKFNEESLRQVKLDQMILKYKQDGFYKFGKEATNLFTTDLNNDGILEIIAPTFSPKLEPYMNILSLNPTTKKLEWSSLSLLNY